MRGFLAPLAAGAVLGFALAPGVSAQQPSRPPVARAEWGLSDLATPAIRWQDASREDSAAGGTRRAVLFISDRYAGRPAWSVAFAQQNVRRMRAVLGQQLGVADEAREELEGQSASGDALRAAIVRAAEQFRGGTGNFLILYFTGHAWVGADGEPVFFTYYTDENGGAYEPVIRRTELHRWLFEAKASARRRGASFQALLIVDACRVGALAPPQTATLTPSADWEWWGTRNGAFAEAPSADAASPFTSAIADAAQVLSRSGRDGSLRDLVQLAARYTRDRTGGRQEPDFLGPGGAPGEPLLVRRQRVRFAVQVVDAQTGLPLPGAQVRVGTDAVPSAVIQSAPGRLALRAEAPGYFRRSEEIEIGPDRSGQLLTIPLHREFLVVRGQIGPPRVAEVRVRPGATENDGGARTTSAPDGRFELRVPASVRGQLVEVVSAGSVLRTVPIVGSPTEFARPPGTGYEGVPVLDLGVVALAAGAPDAPLLSRLSTAAPLTAVRLPAVVSDSILRAPPQLRDAGAAEDLNAAVDHAAAGRWSLARQRLTELLRAPAAREQALAARLEGFLAWVSVREGQAVSDTGAASLTRLLGNEDLVRTHPLTSLALQAAIVQRLAEALDRSVRRSDVGVAEVERAAARLGNAAGRPGSSGLSREWEAVRHWATQALRRGSAQALGALLDSRRWRDAWALAGSLRSQPLDTAGLDSLRRDVAPQALRGLLTQAIIDARASGTWDSARVWGQRAQEFPRDRVLVSLAEEAGREAMPAAARHGYEAGQRAFAEGQLETADSLYESSLAAGASPYYRQLIAGQREFIRGQLYARYVTEGERAIQGGDSARALDGYARAARYDPRVDARIRELRDLGVGSLSHLVEEWEQARLAARSQPRRLVVETVPAGTMVRLLTAAGSTALGNTPLDCRLAAQTVPPDAILRLVLQRQGGLDTVSIGYPAGWGARVFPAPAVDTTLWPERRSRESLAEDVRRAFVPSRLVPPLPPAPRAPAGSRLGLSLLGGVAGGAASFFLGPRTSDWVGPTIGAASGAVVGYVVGLVRDQSRHRAMRRQWPVRYAEAQALVRGQVAAEFQEALDRAVASDFARVSPELVRVRRANAEVVRANARGPLSVAPIAPGLAGGANESWCDSLGPGPAQAAPAPVSPAEGPARLAVGAPVKLAFTVQPSGVRAGRGAVMAPAVQVTVQDARGNTIASATTRITLSITAGAGTAGARVGGTRMRSAASGVATFADLTLDEIGEYTLSATAPGLLGASSGSFTVRLVLASVWTGFAADHTCGLTSGGAAYCWGDNSVGQLGEGSDSSGAAPVAVAGGLHFSQLALGRSHTCGLTAAGVAYCWGNNSDGELGDGGEDNSPTPVAVAGSRIFAQLVAGSFHTCGRTRSGTAYCWGYNPYGQLGDGGNENSSTPVAVAGGVAFARLTAGGDHTCGVTTAGAASCWGYNSDGQLGDGSITNSATPVAVAGSLTFTRMTAGFGHTCGLTGAGVAYCWGKNGVGQLGEGGTTDRSTPVAVSSRLAFSQLTAGGDHNCGWTSAGVGYCWGWNGHGQLGDGGTRDRSTPVVVSGGPAFAQLGAGSRHTCGMTAAGAAWCWGSNGEGQLGDGTATSRPTPVPVKYQ